MALDARVEVFKFGYSEVLAALKHQDDKLNRWLTALSFLTTAGIAIYARALPSGAYLNTLPHSRQHVVTLFFVFFLVGVLAALIGVLGAIGPSGALPPWRRSTPKRSLIYFGEVVKESDTWDAVRRLRTSTLENLLTDNLHRDIQSLSFRVAYKMARAREAGAFSQIAILSLGLLGLFAIPTREMSMSGRWWIAAFVLGVMLVLPLWELAQMRIFHFPEARSFGYAYRGVAAIAVFGVTLLVMAPHFHTHWIALLYALGSILGVRLAHVHRETVGFILALLAGTGLVLVILVATI